MTSLIERLRERLAGKRSDALTRYWQTIEKIAGGTLAERAADSAIEKLDELTQVLGKSPDDATADIDAITQLNAAMAAAAPRNAMRAAAKQSAVVGKELRERAEALRAEAIALEAEADRRNGAARAAAAAADQAAGEAARLRRLLADRGHPVHAGGIEQERDAAAQRQVEAELATVDAEIGDIEQRMARGGYRDTERVEAHLAKLRESRVAVAGRVAELQAEVSQ